jgi:hypothetical protein
MAQPRETEQGPSEAPERNPDLDRDQTVNPESENIQGRADEETEDEFDEVEEEEEEGEEGNREDV